VYGQEAVVPLDHFIPSMCIVVITDMIESGATQEILAQLMGLKEDIIMAGFHKEVQKAKDKAWHDRYIYGNKYLQHPGKLIMHWLGPYQINTITDGGVVQLQDLAGKEVKRMVNGSQLKLYK
jgi:hypothetical protein